MARKWGDGFYIQGATPSEIENIWMGCSLVHLKGWFRDPMFLKWSEDNAFADSFYVPPDADVARYVMSENLNLALSIFGVFWARQESGGTRGEILTKKGGFHWRIKGGGGKFHDIVFAELKQRFPNLITD